jgi:CDP-diacylglycerol--glycerol-3-phosphate 3-phosphatidyltransferase
VDLYRSKSAIVGRLGPVVAWLASRGISPDAVTLAAIPVGVVAAACLLVSPAVPLALLAVPFLAALRLILNLLDGALARRTGRIHPRGEFYNEVGDRLADVLFLAPVAFLPGASSVAVLLGVCLSLIASHAGLASRAAGGERIYRGILSKPGRMVLLSVSAGGAFAFGADAWYVFGSLLLAGALLTLGERLVIAVRSLE